MMQQQIRVAEESGSVFIWSKRATCPNRPMVRQVKERHGIRQTFNLLIGKAASLP